MILYILSNRLSVQNTSNSHKYFRHAQSAMPVSQDPINISKFALYTDNPSLHDLLCLNVCKVCVYECLCLFYGHAVAIAMSLTWGLTSLSENIFRSRVRDKHTFCQKSSLKAKQYLLMSCS